MNGRKMPLKKKVQPKIEESTNKNRKSTPRVEF